MVLLRLSRGMTSSCLCYKPLQDLKSLPGNGHFDLATKVVLLVFIKNDSKMDFFFPPCHKLDMVLSNQYNMSRYSRTQGDFFICGHRETMTKINKLFDHLEFQFCEMFHCMAVTYKVKNEQMIKRNICLQKAWLWKQKVIVLLAAHQIRAASMQCEKDRLWWWVEEKCQERDEQLDKGVWMESEEKAVIDTEKDITREKRILHVGQANPAVQEALALLVDPACNKEEQKERVLLIILGKSIFYILF